MKTALGIAAVVIIVGLGAYFLLAGPSQQSSPTRSAAGPAPGFATQTSSATAAPDFSLPKVGGGTVALADYKGKEPVILDFWATWCPNCARDIPHQEAWYEKYKGKVEVIGVDLQEDPSIVARYVSDHNLMYPVALDSASQVTQGYSVPGTNYHVLIDKNGNIVKTIPGDISEADFISLIGS